MVFLGVVRPRAEWSRITDWVSRPSLGDPAGDQEARRPHRKNPMTIDHAATVFPDEFLSARGENGHPKPPPKLTLNNARYLDSRTPSEVKLRDTTTRALDRYVSHSSVSWARAGKNPRPSSNVRRRKPVDSGWPGRPHPRTHREDYPDRTNETRRWDHAS